MTNEIQKEAEEMTKRKYSAFAGKLRFLRMCKGLTQREISELLSVDRSTISYYEIDRAVPPLPTIIRIAEIYNVSLDYLLLAEVPPEEFQKYPYYNKRS